MVLGSEGMVMGLLNVVEELLNVVVGSWVWL